MSKTAPNQSVKWIRQPVLALADATARPEQLTTYAGRYIAKQIRNKNYGPS